MLDFSQEWALIAGINHQINCFFIALKHDFDAWEETTLGADFPDA